MIHEAWDDAEEATAPMIHSGSDFVVTTKTMEAL